MNVGIQRCLKKVVVPMNSNIIIIMQLMIIILHDFFTERKLEKNQYKPQLVLSFTENESSLFKRHYDMQCAVAFYAT